MRVVITGATGNVGTSLVERLERDSEVSSIVGLARRPPTLSLDKTLFVDADLASDDIRAHLAGADVVVHLAWLFQPTHEPKETWRTNVLGSERLLATIVDAGVGTLIYASSVGAYSPSPTGTANVRVDESWPTHGLPSAAYGREKAYVERLLDAFEARHPKIRVVRMRPSFIFKRRAATEQRRLFAGPFVPNRLARPGQVPILPLPSGLLFQALHADDAAEAYRLAITQPVSGAFNLAAEPVIDAALLGQLLDTRVVEVPRLLARAGLAAAWHAHLAPADPALLDLALGLPLLDTSRASRELEWVPMHTATDALNEMLDGFAHGAGLPTAPLAPDTPGRRIHEIATGVGQRA